MGLFLNVLVILCVAGFALFGTLFVLVRIKQRQMLKAINESNTPKVSVSTGEMKVDQIKKMIEEIDSRILKEGEEELDANLKMALLQVRSKFQNIVDQSNTES